MGAAEISITLSAIAIALVFIVERMRRPILVIEEYTWVPRVPVKWTFAAIRVRNRPLHPLLRAAFIRTAAECCEISLEFRKSGNSDLFLAPIAARWSSHLEPIKDIAVIDSLGRPTIAAQYDPSNVPVTKRLDIPASDESEEVAVAILLADGRAAAFGAESYAFPDLINPDWQLERGVYEVTVRLRASGVTSSRTFTLHNLDRDFARFSELKATG